MHAALGQEDPHATQFGTHKFPFMPGHPGFRQARNLRVGHGKKSVAGLGEPPEPGAQDQSNLRTKSG